MPLAPLTSTFICFVPVPTEYFDQGDWEYGAHIHPAAITCSPSILSVNGPRFTTIDFGGYDQLEKGSTGWLAPFIEPMDWTVCTGMIENRSNTYPSRLRWFRRIPTVFRSNPAEQLY